MNRAEFRRRVNECADEIKSLADQIQATRDSSVALDASRKIRLHSETLQRLVQLRTSGA